MNRSFIVAVLTVTMIIMMSAAGYAAIKPHAFPCENCHGKFSGVSDRALSTMNSCVVCHTSSAEASRMPFDDGAMSNYFGSASDQPSIGSRSTHTWAANSPSGPINSSPAKVVDSLNSTLNNGAVGEAGPVPFANKTACNRCHNVKAGSNDVRGVDKPFLRVSNLNDALCYECHLLRRQSDHATGTHPVAYRAYSTVYKSNTTAFRRVPLSPNPNNPTAKLGNYLSSGKIVCTTCHAPHYADSSSATLDNRSTANGFAQDDPAKGLKGQMQNSKGQLLRTDPIGSSATAINICSSCHKETKNLNHNAKGQNIQCDHCHGAHVDFTGDTSLPNLYLVRRDFSNMSTTKVKLGAGVKVIYNSATSLRFKRADGKGICQICHTPTPGISIHDLGDTTKEDCIECHNHANGFSVADCTTCHGQPPMTSSVGGPNGKASQNYSLDESFTAHASHADSAYYNYACKNCHYDGTRADSHNTLAQTGTATFASVFVETAGSVGDLAGRKNTSGDYTASSKTCASVYCHSTGKPLGGGPMAWKSGSTPSWEYGRNKILGQASECTTCHESGTTLVTNAHYTHVTTNSYKCNVCHAATVNDANGITDRTKHANGTKDVSFSTRPNNYMSVFTADPFNTTDATCINSCHTNGIGGSPATIARWTDAPIGACNTCHAAIPITNAHGFHFYSSTGPMLGASSAICSNCHIYSPGATTHANGVIDKKPCTPCHPGISAVWTNPATVTCESCHTGATASNVNGEIAKLKNLNATLGHGKYAMANTCSTCHDAAADHIGSAEKRLKVTGNAQCNTCHIPAVMLGMSTARANLLVHGGTVDKFTIFTSALNLVNIANLRSDACAGCHDTHGTTNLMSIRTSINGQTVNYTNTSTGFRVTVPTGGIYNGLCQVCHTKVKYFTNYTAPDLSHNEGKNCLTCHKHKGADVMFAFQGSGGGCGGCHGYPPVRVTVTRLPGTIGTQGNYSSAMFQDYSGGGGAHTVAGHIPKTAKAAEAWTNCSNCHYNPTHNTGGTPAKKAFVNVIVDPQFKFSNATSITYNANGNSCSNVSCHFQPSPNWTNGL